MATSKSNGSQGVLPRTLLDTALNYHALGFNVIPVGQNKRPLIKSWERWQTERQTKGVVSGFDWKRADGIAAICGTVSGGLVCVDIDKVPDGHAAAILALMKMPIEYNWWVRTGSRQGFHVWFLCPDLDLGDKGRLDFPCQYGGHIELRYTGHYAILPPSLHESGNRYEFFHHDTTIPPKQVTAKALLKAYNQVVEVPTQPAPPPPAKTPKKEDSHHAYVDKAIASELAKLRGAREGTRNNQLFESAMKLGGFLGNGLDRSRLESDLLFVAQNLGLDVKEATATIRSGLDRAKERQIPERKNGALPPGKLTPEEIQQIKEYGLSDVGNGKRLADMFAGELLFCHEWKTWLIWSGGRWEVDRTAEIERRAKTIAKALHEEVAAIPPEREKLRQAYQKHALRTESAGKIHAMIDMASSEIALKTQVKELDMNPWLLNCENGVLDLKTGRLTPHDPHLRLTKKVNSPYDPEAKCPEWEWFLEEIMGGKKNLRIFLQRAIGYSLTGVTSEQVIFFCYGTGANGKSTMLEALRFLFADYGQNTPITALMRKTDGASPTPDLARLKGARFVTAVESEENQHLSESNVKALTGGDTITARNLFSEPFEFKPELKLWIATNHKPRISGTDNGIWRRIRLIPFAVTIPPENRDPLLPEKLQAEAAGILAWAVRGCLDWLHEGLSTPSEVIDATNAYRSEQDVMAAFFSECCLTGNHMTASASNLYEAYKEWASENNERVLSQRAFGGKLTERGLSRHRSTSGRFVWTGIGLISEPSE